MNLRAILFLLSATSGLALAGPAAAQEDPGAEMRNRFIQAEQALDRKRYQEFLELSQSLQDYPLYPYLQYKALRKRLYRSDFDEVRGFLAEIAGTPLENRLRHAWLVSLARRGLWEQYLQAYQPSRSARLRCYQKRALYKTGHRQEALDGVAELWLSGRSRPRACDPLFDAWRDAGMQSQDLVWQRFQLAMKKRNIGLARYLTRFLPPGEQHWAKLWLRTHRNPSLVLNNTDFNQYHPMRNAIISHGIKQLARKNASAASALWKQTLRDKYQFNEKERTEIVRYITTHLAIQHRPETYQWLVELDPRIVNERISEWRIRTALAQENWEAVTTWIRELPQHERQDVRWQYWQARALEALGQVAQAEDIYLNLAQQRDYYGFLAADRLELPYRFTNHPLNITSDHFRLADHPALLRARELLRLERIVDARREWYFATRDMNAEELQWAAKLAQSWNWHDRAIFTIAQSKHWDDLELRFPLAHYDKIISEASKRGVEPAFAYAVIRQESAFTADARSTAGALGLMQLMPRTARQNARALGIHVNRHSLIDIRTNIRLGMHHLRKVLNEFDNHPLLATAAYNAGEYAVRNWLPDSGSVTADIWAETIPYSETRHYSQTILAFTAIYEQRLGEQPTPLESRMPPVSAQDDVQARRSREDLIKLVDASR